MVLDDPSMQAGTKTFITNMVADALSRNIPVGGITNTEIVRNFPSPELHSAQRDHPLWKLVINALKSGDETYLSELPVPFAQFSYQRTTSFVGHGQPYRYR